MSDTWNHEADAWDDRMHEVPDEEYAGGHRPSWLRRPLSRPDPMSLINQLRRGGHIKDFRDEPLSPEEDRRIHQGYPYATQKEPRKMRNRDHVWTSSGRSIRLEDMEDSHLINLICWLHRQRVTIEDLGLDLPRKCIQGATYNEWLERTRKELHRRRSKEVREAYETLNKEIPCGVSHLQEADD